MSETEYDLSQVHTVATEWLHQRFCPLNGLRQEHTDVDRAVCEAKFRFEAGFLVARLMPSLLREITPKVAREIEAKSCCHPINPHCCCCRTRTQIAAIVRAVPARGDGTGDGQ